MIGKSKDKLSGWRLTSAEKVDTGASLVGLRRNKLIYLMLTILLSAAIIAVAVAVTVRRNSGGIDPSSPAHAILKSACGPTRYAELCYSAVAAVPGISNRLTTKKDVIEASLNLTIQSVQENYFGIKKLIAANKRKLTRRERMALHDCLETIDETLDELYKAEEDLKDYPKGGNKTLARHADDLKTLMSAAMTNQETCLDGFSHDGADKKVRGALLEGQMHVERMCSNGLAMIKNMTDGDVVDSARRLEEGVDFGGWPEWLSAGDRRLLQDRSVTADVVVAADGSGNFRTVSEAVEAAPEKSKRRYVIRIKAGVYRENVEVSKKKTNIMFLGDGRKNTIITGSRSVAGGTTTFKSATVAAVGERFLARGLTFQNTAGASNHQAVALRVGSDLSAFYECDILAYQDTLYVHSNRQFFINCLIVGTVDFIFGNGAAVLQDCDIHARRPNSGQKNMLTAQGRTDPNQNTGIVIQKCRIGATSDLRPVQGSFPTYLGRPWKEYSRTVIMQTSISDVIRREGWHEWSGDFALSTLYYGEYQNTGPGSVTSGRVSWKGFRVITSSSEASQFTPRNFVGGTSWLGSTGFPFSLDL